MYKLQKIKTIYCSWEFIYVVKYKNMKGKAICQPQIIDNEGRGMKCCKGASIEFVAFILFILSYVKKEKQV